MNVQNSFPRMHVSLYVSNLNKSVDFYSSFFDQQPEKVKPGYAKFILDEPSLIISFVENKDRVSQNFGHLGFQVGSEDLLHEKLSATKEKGLELLEEMGTNCCYASQDKFWVKDPDGVQWEVYYFHKDVEFNDPQYAHEDQAACCVAEAEVTGLKVPEASAEPCCEPGSACC